MKEELLLSLSDILEGSVPIKFRVDEIYEIRKQLIPLLTDEEIEQITNQIRSQVQYEAGLYWRNSNMYGAVLMATGTGKSKMAVDAIAEIVLEINISAKTLISVPTEKLRDDNWKDEFIKWGHKNLWDNNVESTCYASLHKITGKTYDLVVLDEGHNITPLNAKFFTTNKIKKLLWLSATKPRDKIKIELLKQFRIKPIYEITLDESVKLGLTPPYEITVITTKLDKEDKYIKSGNAVKGYFFQTEIGKYNWFTTRCITAPNKRNFLDRMRFIYNLKSKSLAAKAILKNVIPKELRTLIFAGSKKEAVLLCNHHFFSRPTKPKGSNLDTPHKLEKYANAFIEYQKMIALWQGDESFTTFKEKRINRMSCIDAVNEGHNIDGVDCCFIVQLNSNELDLWQRMGRIRFRPGIIARIIILCCEDTEDKAWVSKATANLDENNIRWVSIDDLRTGKEKIIF